jgi:preprotein translocase subunit SecG
MIYGFVIGLHVFTCLILIAVILLQAGKGGGLSETFAGDSSQTIFGTKASTFLTKATVVAATVFIITSLLLGIMTSRRGRSLIALERRLAQDINFAPKNVDIPETQDTQAAKVDTKELPLAEPEELPKN